MRHHAQRIFLSIACGLITGSVLFYILAPRLDRKQSSLHYASSYTRSTTNNLISPKPTTPQDFCLDVPILTYHHIQPFEEADPKNQRELTVTPENFAWHMETLQKQGYTFISLDELVEALRAQKPIPQDTKPIVITLDDGYRDAFIYAYPLAQKLNIHLNIGIITGLTGNPEHLTVSQLRTLQESGHISLYNHSWSHMNLSSASEKAIDSQVSKAQQHLKEWLGRDNTVIIYPYGVSGSYVRSILPKHGIQAGFELSLTQKSITQCLSNIYQLPRLRVGNAGPRVYGL